MSCWFFLCVWANNSIFQYTLVETKAGFVLFTEICVILPFVCVHSSYFPASSIYAEVFWLKCFAWIILPHAHVPFLNCSMKMQTKY